MPLINKVPERNEIEMLKLVISNGFNNYYLLSNYINYLIDNSVKLNYNLSDILFDNINIFVPNITFNNKFMDLINIKILDDNNMSKFVNYLDDFFVNSFSRYGHTSKCKMIFNIMYIISYYDLNFKINTDILKLLTKYILKDDKDLTTKYIYKLCDLCNKQNIPLINLFESICSGYGCFIIYDYLISKYKIEPNIKCLENLLMLRHDYFAYDFTPNKLKLIEKILDTKMLIDESIIEYIIDDNQKNKIIELLIKYGLPLSKNVVINCIKKHIEIPNINIYNIEFDDEIFEVMHFYKYYPINYIKEFNNTDQIKYRINFVSIYSNYYNSDCEINMNNVTIDKYCWENMLSTDSNKASFINKDNKYKITYKTLLRIENPVLRYKLFNDYEKELKI
jgi:hypothetical protein